MDFTYSFSHKFQHFQLFLGVLLLSSASDTVSIRSSPLGVVLSTRLVLLAVLIVFTLAVD